MRKIKFRAWDKASWTNNDTDTMSYDINPKCDADVIMQFTGLKDINDKEIYEGDIIKNYAFRDVVIWDKGIFTTKNTTPDEFGCKQSIFIHNELEVVGNIYESPEILERPFSEIDQDLEIIKKDIMARKRKDV